LFGFSGPIPRSGRARNAVSRVESFFDGMTQSSTSEHSTLCVASQEDDRELKARPEAVREHKGKFNQ